MIWYLFKILIIAECSTCCIKFRLKLWTWALPLLVRYLVCIIIPYAVYNSVPRLHLGGLLSYLFRYAVVLINDVFYYIFDFVYWKVLIHIFNIKRTHLCVFLFQFDFVIGITWLNKVVNFGVFALQIFVKSNR
jgi:hypothetical protein